VVQLASANGPLVLELHRVARNRNHREAHVTAEACRKAHSKHGSRIAEMPFLRANPALARTRFTRGASRALQPPSSALPEPRRNPTPFAEGLQSVTAEVPCLSTAADKKLLSAAESIWRLRVAECGTMKHGVDEALARQVAAITFADIRTVRRVLRGERVRGFVGARIRAELERSRSESRPLPLKSP
jgi:hypothetical protein